MQSPQGEITSLQKELHSTKQLNDTKNKTPNSLKTIFLQNKVQATKINDLEIIQKNLEQEVNNLELKNKDLKEREKV